MASSCGVDDLAFDLAKNLFGIFTNATYEDEEVVTHVRMSEGFVVQVRDPVVELVVTHRDKATPLAVKGMAYGEIGVAAVTLFGEVWGL